MSVYFDIKSLYPHLKVNWNMLMCKICIARRLVVDIFPWCNANFVPFPSGTLVARRIGNGSIRVCARRCSGKMVSVLGVFGACAFAVGPLYRSNFLRGESVLMGDSLSRYWIRSHRREMMTQCKRTPAVGVPLTTLNRTRMLIGYGIIRPSNVRFGLHPNVQTLNRTQIDIHWCITVFGLQQ